MSDEAQRKDDRKREGDGAADGEAEGAMHDAADGAVDDKEDLAMRALLKRSLATHDEPAQGAPRPDILRGVQRKIRARSKGKFYADGWSTSQSKVSYLLIALIMLVLVGLAYFVLGPTGFHL